MANPRSLHTTQRLTHFPGGTFNALVAGELRDRQRGGTSQPQSRDAKSSASLRVLVQNVTGANLDERFPIVRLGDAIIQPADLDDAAGAVLNGIAFEAGKPAADTAGEFAVVQGPVETDGMRLAVVQGLTWAKVDVQSESDTHATAAEDDVEKLTSGGGGARIVWKQAGTGVKWAVVLLGSGGDSLRIVMLVDNVPAASALDGTTFEAAAGILASDGETTGGVLLHWDGADLVADDEPARLAVVNLSMTQIRASVSQPVIVVGHAATVDGSSSVVVHNVMDFRSLPGFVAADIQIPFHDEDAEDFKLDAEECTPP